MSNEKDAKTPKKTNWTRIVLVVSLAVNLLVVGVVAGAVLRHDRSPGDMDRRPVLGEFGLGPFGQALSPKDRRAVGREIAGRSAEIRENREEMRRQFDQLLTALRAVPYDQDAVRRITQEQQEKLLERQRIGQELLLDRIARMSDAERAEFADRLERTLRKMRPR